MLRTSIILVQFICVCWGRSSPATTTQRQVRTTVDPIDTWNRLNTVDSGYEVAEEYSRTHPVKEQFGISPSSMYLIESFRLLQHNQLITPAISAFSVSTFEDINQIRLTRPTYQHIYRLVLSKAAIREEYSDTAEVTLWIPLYNHELIRQVDKIQNENLRVCVSQKEKRKKQYCYSLDTTQLDLTEANGHSWIGMEVTNLITREMESGNDKKHLYLYFSLSGCVAVNTRCNSVSFLEPNYLQVLKLANPRVPFVIMKEIDMTS